MSSFHYSSGLLQRSLKNMGDSSIWLLILDNCLNHHPGFYDLGSFRVLLKRTPRSIKLGGKFQTKRETQWL
jgi:hypothetical protein